MRYILFFLFFWSGLSGQKMLILPSQLDTLLAKDSLGLFPEQKGLVLNLRATGTLNNRFPATLIREDGLVLVSKEALERYLPEINDNSDFDAPLPLNGLILTFPVTTENITSQILEGSYTSMSYEKRTQLIQRNIGRIMLEARKTNNLRKEVKRYQLQNRFFLHEYQDYSDLQLIFVSNNPLGNNYGIIKILGESPLPQAPSLLPNDSITRANYTISHPQKTYYQSSSSALDLHLLSLESTLKLLKPTIEIYHSLRKEPAPSLINYLHSQEYELNYLTNSQTLSNKLRTENAWLVNQNIVSTYQQLNQEKKNIENLHRQYFLSLSLNQSIRLIQLSRFLQGREGRRSAQQQNILSYLNTWQKDWDPGLDQALFSQLMTIYFEESRADYFSTAIIDQIRSNNKSFEALGNQLYEESLLARPQQLLKILNEKGTSDFFSLLRKDIGYIFFTQLVRDQQERIFRPYRKKLNNWTNQENQWLQQIAGFNDSIIDANGSQRIHFYLSEKLQNIPLWKGTGGSPVFNQQNQLMGFIFPKEDYQPGLEWNIKNQDSELQFITIAEVLDKL